MSKRHDNYVGIVDSITPGIGSFLTLKISKFETKIAIWMYRCYWEIKDKNDCLIFNCNENLQNFDWDKLIGEQVESIVSSPNMLEIILSTAKFVCISEERIGDSELIGVKIFINDNHLLNFIF